MGKFVVLFKGGMVPEADEERKRVMDAWMAWFGGLGDSVVDPGNPFGPSAAAGGGSTSGLTGYTILNAASLDDALVKVGSCPILNDADGGIEVYEAMDM